MKKILNKKRFVSFIIVGEFIILLLWLVNLHSTEETGKLLIFFPIMTIALAIVVQIHNYFLDKIEEEKNLKTNLKKG